MAADKGIDRILPDLGLPPSPPDMASGIGELIPTDPADPRDIARLAITTLLADRRQPTETCPPADAICEGCIEPHIQKLTETAEEGAPLQFMLLGFPCKSPNPKKVLGDLPDMAEIVSLHHISGWADRIKSFYEPGAEIIVGADGRTFTDLVEVPDETVSDYIASIRGIIQDAGLPINYVGIDELLPDLAERQDYDSLRGTLTDQAEPLDVLRERAQQDPDSYQVNGIERFLADDLGYVFPDLSKNQLKKLARQRAYDIIRRGDVLRGALEVQFPRAARLSIHAQKTHGGKLGVHITPSRQDNATPWHSTLVRLEDGSVRLTRQSEAEERGARLVYFDDGQPSHFELSTDASKSHQ
jgi:L-tyrosine isonitrile synthase